MQQPFHRLPTVSASQALLNLTDSGAKYVPSGLPPLDSVFSGGSLRGGSSIGGFERGKVTEIWGANGAGKTAVAYVFLVSMWESSEWWLTDSVAGFKLPPVYLNTLELLCGWVRARLSEDDSWLEHHTHHVADSTKPLNITRAETVISEASSCPAKLHRVNVSTLSHLLAFSLRPSVELIPPDTELLVVTGLNALADLDYPRYQTITSQKSEQQKWQAGRRYATLGSLITALNKVAVLHNLAVLVTTSCSMRMRSESGLGSAIVPGVGGQEWDAGVWNRLVVFRDFAGRFIGVQKCAGKSLISRDQTGEAGRIIAFEIDSRGTLREQQAKVSDEAATHAPKLRTSSAPKRSYDEIANSEDEDVDEYGWIDTDEHALAMESLVEETERPEHDNQTG